MIVDSFKNRLQLAMNNISMKQVELCEKTGIDKTLINKYLAGKSNAKQKKLTLLANALRVSEVWLMGYDVPMHSDVKLNSNGEPIDFIPVLSNISIDLDNNLSRHSIDKISIPHDLAITGDFFAIKVYNDSMAPAFLQGDILVVKSQSTCENNEFAIVVIDNKEWKLRKIRHTDNGIILQPLNPSYEPELYTFSEVKQLPLSIIGIVKKLYRDF